MYGSLLRKDSHKESFINMLRLNTGTQTEILFDQQMIRIDGALEDVRRASDDLDKFLTSQGKSAHHHDHQALGNPGSCPICFELPTNQYVLNYCGHIACRYCLTEYLNYSVRNSEFPIKCPFRDCRLPVLHSDWTGLLNEAECESLYEISLSRFVEQRPNEYFWCSSSGCKQIIERSASQVQCPSCSVVWCTKCQINMDEVPLLPGATAHKGFSCSVWNEQIEKSRDIAVKASEIAKNAWPLIETQDWEGALKAFSQVYDLNPYNTDVVKALEIISSCGKEWEQKCVHLKMQMSEKKYEFANMEWLLEHTKPCPSCKIPIEKNAGCNHMSCSRCSTQFCWVCSKPWSGHDNYFACNN